MPFHSYKVPYVVPVLWYNCKVPREQQPPRVSSCGVCTLNIREINVSKIKCMSGIIDSARKFYERIFCYFSALLPLIKVHGRLMIWKPTSCQPFFIEKVNHQSFQTRDVMLDKSCQFFCIYYKMARVQLFLTHIGIKRCTGVTDTL